MTLSVDKLMIFLVENSHIYNLKTTVWKHSHLNVVKHHPAFGQFIAG